MKKYFVFTSFLLTFTFINLTASAQSLASISYNDPLCFGVPSGNATVTINQTLAADM